MFDLLREIAQTLRHNKLRLALTGFAVAWGIFMLIILLGLARGLVNGFDANMSRMSTDYISVEGGITTKPYKGHRDGRIIQLKESDESLLATDANRITAISPSTSNDTVNFTFGSETTSSGYTGVCPSALRQDGYTIVEGRFINEADIKSMRKAVVLELASARKLFGDSAKAVGSRVSASGLSWTVVGVYNHPWRSSELIPYTTAVAISGYSEDVDKFNLKIADVTTEEEGNALEEEVRGRLARAHSFDPADESALWIRNRFSENEKVNSVSHILTSVMWVIGILTLLSGIVGVSNIMFVSVRERTHEIGIRRAIGARPRNILTQVVLESVAITTIFGYVGIVAGTLVMAGVASAIGTSVPMIKDPGVTLPTAAAVTGVLIVAGALAGIFPALRATKVKPVEALRDE